MEIELAGLVTDEGLGEERGCRASWGSFEPGQLGECDV